MTRHQKVPLRDLVTAPDTWNAARVDGDTAFTYIELAAVDQDSKVIATPRQILAREAPSRARQLVAHRDVLVSTVRPNLNAVALVPASLDTAIASTGFCVLRSNPTRLDSSYLFHWVKTPEFVSHMVRCATGASYPAISDRIVLSSELPLPPLPEQRRLAAILDQADALRAKRRTALAKLDDLARSNFFEFFGDPVTNSRGWAENKVLDDVADIVSGITKGRKLNGVSTRAVPYLAVVNVQDRRLDLNTVKTIQATEAEISRYHLQRDDLLLTEGGDPDKLGRGSLWSEEISECIHQNHIFRVRLTNDHLTPLFLNWLIGSERGKRYFLKSAKQTTGIASINLRQLRAFPILAPPLTLQRRFAAAIESVSALTADVQQSLANLDSLFASLQHRAFRGEL